MAFSKKATKKASSLSPEQKYWQTVSEQAKPLIAKCLIQSLPLNPAPNILKLDHDKEFQNLISQELPTLYQDEEELPESQLMAEELTYHYLNTVCSNIQEQLTNYEEQ